MVQAYTLFLIMVNCSIHHATKVVKSIQDVGALVHVQFLPPYLLDFAPMVETFLSKTGCESVEEKSHH